MAATRLVYKNLILYVNAVFLITFLKENLKDNRIFALTLRSQTLGVGFFDWQ